VTLIDQVTSGGKAKKTAGAAPALPAGVKLQSWYHDKRGRVVKTSRPVPVDANNDLVPLLDYRCPVGQCDVQEWHPARATRYCTDHGKALVLRQDGRRVDRARSLVADTYRLHGASASPWVCLTVACAAAGGAHVAGPGRAVVGLSVAVGATYLAARARALRTARKRGMRRGERQGTHARYVRRMTKRAGIVAGAAATCAMVASVVDPHTVFGAITYTALLGGWALAAVPTWRRADDRRAFLTSRPAAPALPDGPVEEVSPDLVLKAQALGLWASNIGNQNGPLAGTKLVDWERLPECAAGGPDRPRQPNWTAAVITPQGAPAVSMRKPRPDLLGAIAAAYGVSTADVSFAADPHNNSRATVRVCPDNPLAEVRYWAGPAGTNWERGTTTIGRFEDGRPITFEFWNEDGASHAMFSGCSGSGKSELIVQLLLTALHSGGRVLPWVADPQRGQSYGPLREHVDWFATTLDEIKFMLMAATAEMQRRNDVLTARYQKTWRPTRDMPLLVLCLDEVQAYAKDDVVQELLEKLAGMARKVGIVLWLITQVTAAYAFGGGNLYVKEQMRQRLVFRASTSQAAGHAVEDGEMIDATTLPKAWGPSTAGAGRTTAGLLFVSGPHGCDVFGRTDYTGESAEMARWLVDANGAPTTTPGWFDAAAAAYSGPLWGGRRERQAAAAGTGLDLQGLLAGGKAAQLLDAAAGLQNDPNYKPQPAVNPLVSLPDPARNRVLRTAQKVADPDGFVTKTALVEATPDVPTNTRDRAIADLRQSGEFAPVEDADGKVRRGVYKVAPADE
jgi:hypothetical protein